MNGRPPAAIVVLHEHARVHEFIEMALRDRGARVLATRDSFEALEIVRRLKVDLIVLSRAESEMARDLPASEPGLSAVVVSDEPMWLAEIAHAVVTALAPRE